MTFVEKAAIEIDPYFKVKQLSFRVGIMATRTRLMGRNSRAMVGRWRWPIRKLVTIAQLPEWLMDNRYILRWYRPSSLTYRQCLWSMLQIHNQTANIWTHLIGFVLIQYHNAYLFPTHLTEPIDIFMMSVTYAGITMSFYCSVVYHVFNSCSFELSCFLSRVDYFGIICHITGCMLCLVYYVYYQQPVMQALYLTLFLVVGSVCLVMNYYSMFSSITQSMSSHKRTAFFGFVVLLSLPPQILLCQRYSWQVTWQACFTDFAYILAALVYAFKYPEKLKPGQFDLINSHTIFHVIIIIAGFGSVKSLSLISFYETNINNITNE